MTLSTRACTWLSCIALGVIASATFAHDSIYERLDQRARFPTPFFMSAGIDSPFTKSNVTLMGWASLFDFDETRASDCWGYTSPSGREYALICLFRSLAVVEVTDPGAPVVLDVIPAPTTFLRDVKVYGDYAYHGGEGGGGLATIDLTQVDNGIVGDLGSVALPGPQMTHNIVINPDSPYVYACGGGTTVGLRIFSLADPTNPTFVGEWNDRYVHDAQIVTYTSGPFSGREIAFCFTETTASGGATGVDVLDVTDKNNIFTVDQLLYSGNFSHQGWMDATRQYMYFGDEADESDQGLPTTTRILDISDPGNISLVGSFTNGLTTTDHNLYMKDDLVYEANYMSGLRVFDATNRTAPTEVAFLDTFDLDIPGFAGVFSVYPFFDSGTVIMSDFTRGLLVVRVGDPAIEITAPATPTLVDPNGQVFDVTVNVAPGTVLDPTSPMLNVDTGAGLTSSPLVDLGGGMYRATLPSVTCGTPVQWSFSARTTDGATYSCPEGAPHVLFSATSASSVDVVAEFDIESNPFWILGLGSDTATQGVWLRGDPQGDSYQPDDDHTPDGNLCYYTGTGIAVGQGDVDGGTTSLVTRTINLSAGDATISYWRWFAAGTALAGGKPSGSVLGDEFRVHVSNDNGQNWTSVETVSGGDDDALGGWFSHSFLVSDFVTPTGQVRVRFQAEDGGPASLVEAAVDDLVVARYDCETCQTNIGFGGPGTATLSVCGSDLTSGTMAEMLLTGAPASTPVLLAFGLSNLPLPAFGGLLVPSPPLFPPTLSTNASGDLFIPGIPGGGGPVTVYLQALYGDASQTTGVGLSNALELQFGP